MPDSDRATSISVRVAGPEDVDWIAALLEDRWGSTNVARLGRLVDAASLPGLVAEVAAGRCGLATYRRDADGTELVTIDALEERRGVGTALLAELVRLETAAGARRIWLVTTNDNLEALRFYQRRGLRLEAVHPGAVTASRRLKPTIPSVGRHRIPIRDELVLSIELAAPA